MPMGPVHADVAAANLDGVLILKLINTLFPGSVEEVILKSNIS